MSTSPLWLQTACQVLRARVRYLDAGLSLNPDDPFSKDTAAIQDATRIYTESWIVSLLDAIELGDAKLVKRMTWNDRVAAIGSESPAEKRARQTRHACRKSHERADQRA